MAAANVTSVASVASATALLLMLLSMMLTCSTLTNVDEAEAAGWRNEDMGTQRAAPRSENECRETLSYFTDGSRSFDATQMLLSWRPHDLHKFFYVTATAAATVS